MLFLLLFFLLLKALQLLRKSRKCVCVRREPVGAAGRGHTSVCWKYVACPGASSEGVFQGFVCQFRNPTCAPTSFRKTCRYQDPKQSSASDRPRLDLVGQLIRSGAHRVRGHRAELLCASLAPPSVSALSVFHGGLCLPWL